MNSIFAVAVGGAIGSVLRYLFNIEVTKALGSNFPWGILFINILGCFVMGVIAESFALKFSAPQEMRSFMMTGILGGFTTFSAFALDTGMLVERNEAGLAGLYVLASVGGAILALFLGLWTVRTVFA
ncbi:fluoride efflux transporter CrcB [Parvibaculum sp.]|uniref:fluoride efflux transporter CrcB n=1 Tax=Parvibaculum sp. TaxID=2024848 RepID=UPI002D0B886B|nr:fluoride efflux transporter CrcB [Parvibaculum sp.]HUD52376.1 fluoride efflux transporter CrcB [Parvibaculum sp.]